MSTQFTNTQVKKHANCTRRKTRQMSKKGHARAQKKLAWEEETFVTPVCVPYMQLHMVHNGEKLRITHLGMFVGNPIYRLGLWPTSLPHQEGRRAFLGSFNIQ